MYKMIFNIHTNEKYTKDTGLATSSVDIIRFRKGYVFAMSRNVWTQKDDIASWID